MRLPPGGFAKYHALGNDYLVTMAASAACAAPSPRWVRAACHRHLGVGADGLLWLAPAPAGSGCEAALTIFNPDGGEAERSGNGLRIAAQALLDFAGLPPPRLRLWTATGRVEVRQLAASGAARPPVLEVDMGTPRHGLAAVAGGSGATAEATTQVRVAAGEEACLALALVSVGNPHAVWWRPRLDEALFARWAAAISRAPIFPRGINVQMATVLGRHRVAARIFERGVGPTQASGSSACAVAATAWRQGLCHAPLTVQMPGGELVVDRRPTGILLRGPVELVCTGQWPRDEGPGAADAKVFSL